jgi:predicted permease
MAIFISILYHNIIPLTLMIAAGIVLHRAFRLDIRTLSKLIFYLFTPAVIFRLLYESTISFSTMLKVIGFVLVYLVVLGCVAEIAMRIRGTAGRLRTAMRNSVLFYNSANYALPLNQLVFVGDAFTLSVQSIVMILQSLIPYTYGIYSVSAHKAGGRETARKILSMPVIYCIPLALLMRGFHIGVPAPIYTPVTYVADAYMAIALLTLGVQLGSMKWTLKIPDVYLANVLRLCVGPAVGFAIVLLFGFHGLIAKALVLSCAVPTSLSSVLLAVEFDNEPEFASQTVFASTVFSVLTVTFVIFLLQFIA